MLYYFGAGFAEQKMVNVFSKNEHKPGPSNMRSASLNCQPSIQKFCSLVRLVLTFLVRAAAISTTLSEYNFTGWVVVGQRFLCWIMLLKGWGMDAKKTIMNCNNEGPSSDQERAIPNCQRNTREWTCFIPANVFPTTWCIYKKGVMSWRSCNPVLRQHKVSTKQICTLVHVG